MTTQIIERTSTDKTTKGRYCEGCPRCTDADAGFCPTNHVAYNRLHPVCKRCGHCVMRGKHDDNTSDIKWN